MNNRLIMTVTCKVAVIWFVLLVYSCGQTSHPATNTIISTPTSHLSPSPYITSARTRAPTLTRPPTLSPYPSLTAKSTAREETRVAYTTAFAPFSKYCIRELVSTDISPDKNWAYCDLGVFISLIRNDGSYWVFSTEAYFGQVISYWTSPPALWTRDGKSVYFALKQSMEGPSSFSYEEMPFIALFRMDLTSGKVVAVLPASLDYFPFYRFSFSPDEHWLAWAEARFSGSMVKIRDLTTDIEFTIQFNDQYSLSVFDTDAFSWSEDSQKLFTRINSMDGYHLAEVNVLTRSNPVISRATPYPTIGFQPTP